MKILIKQFQIFYYIIVRWAVVLVYVLLGEYSYSQSVDFNQVFYNISTENGLPSLETYSVKQDSKGYIWICSDAGVTRYDGFEFKTYTVTDGLTDNVVFDVYEDYKGRVWFLTYNAILCYYENEIIKTYKYNYLIEPIVKNKSIITRKFSIDKNETIVYQLGNCGILKIDKSGNFKQLIPTSIDFLVSKINNELYISRNTNSMYSFKNLGLQARLRILINGKYNYIDTATKSSRFFAPQEKYNLNSNYFLFENKIYDYSTGKFLYSNNGLLHFIVRDSIFWICSSEGLRMGVLKNDRIVIQKVFVENYVVSNIEFLKDGSIWISTLNSGILVINNFGLSIANKQSGLKNSEVTSIGKFKNDFLVGSMESLQSISKSTNFNLDLDFYGGVRFVQIKNQLIVTNSVFSKIKKIKKDIYGIPWSSGFVVKNNLIYFTKLGTITEYNINTNTEKVVYGTVKNNLIDGDLHFQKIIMNDKKEIIISSKNQLFCFKNNQLTPISIPFNQRIDICSIQFHENWGIIIGTTGHGIYLFKDNKLNVINTKKGLLNDRINTLAITQEGDILAGSPNGMSIIKPNGEIGVFGQNQTLYTADVNVIFVDNEHLYIGAKSGLFKLRRTIIEKCFEKKDPIKIQLSKVVFDQEEMPFKTDLSFPSEFTMLQLNFQVFQFTNWYSKKYQYKVGVDGSWVTIESPSISLYKPSGDFEVFVRYMDDYNKWSNSTKLCSVHVIMPFWKRWYFWTSIGFTVLLFVFFLFQRAQRRIQEKLIVTSQMLSLEQQMENARMNPHFIFNVLNSIHSYMLNEELEKADLYLMKFSKLMREILGSTKEGVIKVKEETSILSKYMELEQLRYKHTFEYIIRGADTIYSISIPSMMIQPFVENAVLYSKKDDGVGAIITVHFELFSPTILKVTIVNPGVPSAEGLKAMQEWNTKNAIGITRKRLENYNKLNSSSIYGVDIQLMDNDFTSVVLMIPIIKG